MDFTKVYLGNTPVSSLYKGSDKIVDFRSSVVYDPEKVYIPQSIINETVEYAEQFYKQKYLTAYPKPKVPYSELKKFYLLHGNDSQKKFVEFIDLLALSTGHDFSDDSEWDCFIDFNWVDVYLWRGKYYSGDSLFALKKKDPSAQPVKQSFQTLEGLPFIPFLKGSILPSQDVFPYRFRSSSVASSTATQDSFFIPWEDMNNYNFLEGTTVEKTQGGNGFIVTPPKGYNSNVQGSYRTYVETISKLYGGKIPSENIGYVSPPMSAEDIQKAADYWQSQANNLQSKELQGVSSTVHSEKVSDKLDDLLGFLSSHSLSIGVGTNFFANSVPVNSGEAEFLNMMFTKDKALSDLSLEVVEKGYVGLTTSQAKDVFSDFPYLSSLQLQDWYKSGNLPDSLDTLLSPKGITSVEDYIRLAEEYKKSSVTSFAQDVVIQDMLGFLEKDSEGNIVFDSNKLLPSKDKVDSYKPDDVVVLDPTSPDSYTSATLTRRDNDIVQAYFAYFRIRNFLLDSYSGDTFVPRWGFSSNNIYKHPADDFSYIFWSLFCDLLYTSNRSTEELVETSTDGLIFPSSFTKLKSYITPSEAYDYAEKYLLYSLNSGGSVGGSGEILQKIEELKNEMGSVGENLNVFASEEYLNKVKNEEKISAAKLAAIETVSADGLNYPARIKREHDVIYSTAERALYTDTMGTTISVPVGKIEREFQAGSFQLTREQSINVATRNVAMDEQGLQNRKQYEEDQETYGDGENAFKPFGVGLEFEDLQNQSPEVKSLVAEIYGNVISKIKTFKFFGTTSGGE